MNFKSLRAFAGVSSFVLASTASYAAYTGLQVQLHTTVVAGGSARSVYRVYATFSEPNDYVTAIAGSDLVGNLTIQSRNSSDSGPGSNFYNPGAGAAGNTAPSGPGDPNEWGTYACIGISYGFQGSGPTATPDETGYSPGFPNFIAGSSIITNSISWFTSGPVEQGRAGYMADGDSELRVQIMQLSVNAGGNVRGTVAVSGVSAVRQFLSIGQTFNSHDGVPIFLQHPTAATIDAGQSVSFSVVTSSQTATQYQWRRNGTSLTEGGSVSGSNTTTLTINRAGMGHAGTYDVIATNATGPAASNPASLTVICRGDVNHNLAVNVDDLLIVIGFWHANPPAYPPADITGDGYVGVDDLLAVINHWGPCP